MSLVSFELQKVVRTCFERIKIGSIFRLFALRGGEPIGLYEKIDSGHAIRLKVFNSARVNGSIGGTAILVSEDIVEIDTEPRLVMTFTEET